MVDDRERNDSSDSQGAITQHPRRPPAHKSVSLLHSPRTFQHLARRQRQKVSAHNPANVSPVLSQPAYPEKNSSGESSNAERWFESSNNNVQTGPATLVDNDPPFFLRNSSSSEASPDMPTGDQPHPQTISISLAHRAGLYGIGKLETAESSSDDFRSVIDDLTIENKRLRKKLRKYERLHDAHLQADKLFEIRIHGLSADKKRELEETLQKFASSLDATSRSKMSNTSSKHFVAKLQTASSLANTDSAYASMSGQNQSMQSGQGSKLRNISNPGMSQSQQQSIQNYLHDIPTGLFSQQQPEMTEKTKRKIVVRRMEQIFAGKGAADFGHQQPMQQQEVAQSAAQADRMVIEKSGREAHQEGAREARIIPISKHHGESKSAGIREKHSGESTEHINVETKTSGGDTGGEDTGGEESPDQRPTRPLDLDSHRAQVPSDNIKYMRHLGFSPPEAGTTAQPKDDHGWVYLNVLTNMAQLHTINVTPDFIKRAISDHSQRLELSADGRKVRWKGGDERTENSSGDSPEDGVHESNQQSLPNDRGIHGKLSGNSIASSDHVTKSAQPMLNAKTKKLAYVPLFIHQDQSDEASDKEQSAGLSSPMEVTAADSSALPSSETPLDSPKKYRVDDGPIIFYNKATFFTDLSGDVRSRKIDTGDVRHYSTNSLQPMGLPENGDADRNKFDDDALKGPLSRPAVGADTNAIEPDQTSESQSDVVTGLSRPHSIRTSSEEDIHQPVDFEVSGLGGVHPSDNFAINVKSRKRLAAEGSLPTIQESRNKKYSPHIQNLLTESSTGASRSSNQTPQCTIVEEIISSHREELPASRLPDPSFYPFGPEGESDEDDDDYGSDSSSSASNSETSKARTTTRPLPSSILQLMNWNIMDTDSGSESGDEGDDDDEDEDMDDDESIDLLAEARKVAPNAIHAREREYYGNMADRLADEIPAGSSAATAGGGSGFNSPVLLLDAGVKDVVSKAPTLKRARVSDGSLEHGRPKSPRVE